MQTQTKILIYLAVWRRPNITELCFRGIKRLQASFNIEALAVISEPSMIPLCEAYGINWVMHNNEPLALKKNFGLHKAQEFDFDYLMEIGSDDLILNELIDDYIQNYVGKYDFFGISDAAYIDSETGDCRRLISKSTYGAGRMISRAVLEKMNWNIWTDKLNRGLDNNSVFNIQRNGFVYKRVSPLEFPCVVDVKSMENIWKFNYFLGVEYDINEVLKRISHDEVEMIESLYVTA